MKRLLSLSTLTLGMLTLFPGCDGNNGTGPGGLLMEEAREVLIERLAAAYEKRDLAEYEALVHPDFRFTFINGEAPGGTVEGAWGKTTDLAAMLALFGSEAVDSIDFEISIPDEEMTVVEGTAGKYDYRASTIAGWMVTMVDAGKTADTLVAVSVHTYHLRTDPADGAFKIYDQIEEATVNADTYFGTGIDLMSWGALKEQYLEPLSAPMTRTLKGTVIIDSTGGAMEGATVTAGDRRDTTDAFGRFEVTEVPGSGTSAVFSHGGMYDEVVKLAGGDEVVRVDVEMSPLPFHETPATIITEELAAAYSRHDSVRYATLLDSRYRFELVPEEVDPNDPNPWWELAEELDLTGTMFFGRYNDAGQRVTRIRLTMDDRSTRAIVDSLPDQPAGEAWYVTTALVDLLVVIEDPNDPEGIINFKMASDQIFVLRPDPGHERRYLVYRQEDQHPLYKVPPFGTPNVSWSGIKQLFR